MGYNFRSFAVIILLLFCNTKLFSQANYSELSLTGRGDLQLVGDSYKLQPTAMESFLKMRQKALNEGVSIQIVSAYRSFKRQKNIWNKKYKKLINKGFSPKIAISKIIEYSTLPGTSRHHWGTDIDIIDGFAATPKKVLIANNYNKKGCYYKLKKWMDKNAEDFGFYLVYTNKLGRKGFKYEPWHYSYKPLSKKILQEFLKLNLRKISKKNELYGSNFLSESFIKKYINENILDINPALK